MKTLDEHILLNLLTERSMALATDNKDRLAELDKRIAMHKQKMIEKAIQQQKGEM